MAKVASQSPEADPPAVVVQYDSIKEALPYPYSLPMSHGGNAKVPPEKWGLAATQFLGFLEACRSVSSWSDLEEHEDEYKTAGSVSGYQMATSFVKPYTASTGCSVALLLNQEPEQATVMISHGWGEDMNQVLAILNHEIEAQSKMEPQTVIWFCLLANYQPEDGAGPSISSQLAKDPFGRVISLADSMVVFHTSTLDVYTRLWCAYECDKAVKVKGPRFVEHLHSPQFLAEKVQNELQQSRRVVLFVASVGCLLTFVIVLVVSVASDCAVGTYSFVIPLLIGGIGVGLCIAGVHYMQFKSLQVHTGDAECSRDDDTQMITATIQEHGGFERLDQRVYDVRRLDPQLRQLPPCPCCESCQCHRCGDLICGAPESTRSRCTIICGWVCSGLMIAGALVTLSLSTVSAAKSGMMLSILHSLEKCG